MNDLNEELQQRIAAYIDGTLAPAEAARLEVYLANTDPALADGIVGMLSDKSQLRGLPRPQAPADLAGRIMEQIERQSLLREEEPASRRRWWQSGAAIAAGLAIVLGGFTYFVASSVRRPPQDGWTGTQGQLGGKLANAQGTSDLKGETSARRPSSSPAMASGPMATEVDLKGKDVVTAMTMPSELKKEAAASPTPTVPRIASEDKSVTTEEPSARQLAVAGVPTTPSRGDLRDETRVALPEGVAGARGMNDVAGGAMGGMGGGMAMGGGGGAGGMGGGYGGGGRGGGGRGGRGGAAPAAAAAAPVVAATPTVSNVVQTLAPTSENALRTLAALTRESQGPMVVTFYARENGDFAKLANTLISYAEANAPAILNRDQGSAYALQQEGARGVPQTPPSAAPSATVAPSAPAFDSLQKSNVSVGLNSAGVIVLENIAQASENGARARAVYNQSVNNRISGDTPASSGGPSVSGVDAQNVNSSLSVQSTQVSSTRAGANEIGRASQSGQTVQQVAASGGPYHVVLRPEQLEELSRNYRLAAVARGDAVVQFQTVGDRTPQTVNARGRQELLRRSGFNINPTAAAAVNEPKMERDAVSTPAAPVSIDCVITMEPSPVPATNP